MYEEDLVLDMRVIRERLGSTDHRMSSETLPATAEVLIVWKSLAG